MRCSDRNKNRVSLSFAQLPGNIDLGRKKHEYSLHLRIVLKDVLKVISSNFGICKSDYVACLRFQCRHNTSNTLYSNLFKLYVLDTPCWFLLWLQQI